METRAVTVGGLQGLDYHEFGQDHQQSVADLPIVGEVDPYAVIGASIERYVRDDVIEPVVAQYLDVRLRIQRGKRLSRLKLPKTDNGALDLIRAEPINARNLIKQSSLGEQRTRRVLYAHPGGQPALSAYAGVL